MCMYVDIYACIYGCITCACVFNMCACGWLSACLHACMSACKHVSMSACVYAYMCMSQCMHVCMYTYQHVCMYACMYVCMYVCVCICICVYVCRYARTYVCTHVGMYAHVMNAFVCECPNPPLLTLPEYTPAAEKQKKSALEPSQRQTLTSNSPHRLHLKYQQPKL